MSEPTPPPSHSSRARAEVGQQSTFRWQALFQHSTDALFVLDRQRRLRFVNRAWEALTGLTAADVRLLSCKQAKAAGPGDSSLEVLAGALAPPPEVLRGEFGRARRRLPGRGRVGWRYWDIEFLPLRVDGRTASVFGRIVPVAETAEPTAAPLPQRLLDLRERVVRRDDSGLLDDSATPAPRRLAEQVRLAASLSVPVLLTGEPGTGKEALARSIHYRGPFREQPLAAVDCARLPAAAIACLVFGERGAGGTRLKAIYLREPGQLPRDLQLQLVGLIGTELAPRIIAGSSISPEDEVRAGRLLGELYAAFPLVLGLPPLRERMADLPDLIQRALERANEEGGARVVGLTPEATEVVRRYPWPGNWREFYDVLALARRHAAGALIDAPDLPAPLRLRYAAGPAPAADRPLPLNTLLERAERRIIELALRRAKGNRARAAEMLGIWRARLVRRIAALGLDGPAATDDEA